MFIRVIKRWHEEVKIEKKEKENVCMNESSSEKQESFILGKQSHSRSRFTYFTQFVIGYLCFQKLSYPVSIDENILNNGSFNEKFQKEFTTLYVRIGFLFFLSLPFLFFFSVF